MITRYSVRISELRNLLASTFSDGELIALCQDEFDELYVKIGMGRGLMKEEIINAIIDYFQRRNDFTSLLSAVKNRKPNDNKEYEDRLMSYTKSDS